MTTYRIVCTQQSAPNPHHAHIVNVGVGEDPDKASASYTVQQVRNMLDAGDVFYTAAGQNQIAGVRKFDCACGVKTIRSNPDATTANNLDNLRTCNWR